MRNNIGKILFCILGLASFSLGAVHISKATVSNVESGVRTTNGTKYVIVYFSNLDIGWYTNVPQNNGYFYGSQTSGPTQDSFPNKPSLYLADDNSTNGEVANRQFMLAEVLSAQASGLSVAFVWDDANNKIISIQTQ
jgi:hypothetical protein